MADLVTIERTGLAGGFAGIPAYLPRQPYQLLPFRFGRLASGRVLLTNLVGEYVVLPPEEFGELHAGTLSVQSDVYRRLVSRHFVLENASGASLELLAAKVRTRLATLAEFTGLHIFVVTLRCAHSCPYCQVSRVTQDREAFDMSADTASRAVKLMLQSPSRTLKCEFQGGEPLLAFDRIRQVVHDIEAAIESTRHVDFVIATNLVNITAEMLAFCRDHNITISTSLDGPAALHNKNRPTQSHDSYERVVAAIKRTREALGPASVSALMTSTIDSLDLPGEIIDEYVALGFSSIFLRWISPYGFAVRSEAKIGYDTERFIDFYKAGLDYVLELNMSGIEIREEYAAIIVEKMFSAHGSGYVDLTSPAGLGVGAVVYNYDGDVYASDEARMLAAMGDKKFRLGNLERSTYADLYLHSGLVEMLLDTMAERIPGCHDCVYQPWCGTDPVYHYATQGDTIGHRPTSHFCSRNMAIFEYVLSVLEEGSQRSEILRSWCR